MVLYWETVEGGEGGSWPDALTRKSRSRNLALLVCGAAFSLLSLGWWCFSRLPLGDAVRHVIISVVQHVLESTCSAGGRSGRDVRAGGRSFLFLSFQLVQGESLDTERGHLTSMLLWERV